MRKLNHYMRSKNLRIDLQLKIKKYLEYAWKEEKDFKEIDENLLSKLSHTLKSKMKMQIHNDILQKMKIITHHFSKEFCEDLLTSMEHLRLPPKEMIFEVIKFSKIRNHI